MTKINNAQTTNSFSTYSAKGYTGIASGLDTESIVETMTSDIQAKIDKVKKEQQKYDWKQEAYREVITSLTDFQDKYFSYSSSTNLLSSNFYNCTTMVAGGNNASKISVSDIASTTSPTYSITGISQLAQKAGFTSGGSKTSGDITTGEISFGDRQASLVAGGSVSIKYGSSVYTVSIPSDADIADANSLSTALNTAMSKNNLSIGGTLADKLKFSADSDGKMSLEFVNSDDSNTFSISGGSTEVLNALHMSSGDTQSGGTIVGDVSTTESDLMHTVKFDLTGKELTFDLNGSSKTIKFTADDSTNATDINSLQQLLTEKINAKFGENKIKVSVNGTGLSFGTVKSDGSGGQIEDTTSILKISSGTADTLGTKGIFNVSNGEKNRLDTSKTLKELGFTASSTTAEGVNEYKFKVNEVDFNFGDDATIASVLKSINNNTDVGVNVTFLSTSGRFSVMADESGVQGRVDFEDMGSGNIIEGLFGTKAEREAATDAGQDMKMTIQYEGSDTDVEINRSSNTASIDGINFTAKGIFSSATEDDEISFTTKAETDDIVSTIKTMAEDYNKILDSVNKLVTTKSRSNKHNQSVYEPLTDAQKKEMTADEIKAWEKKAKEGILFGDSTLTKLASDLRFVFSTAVSNVGVASSIGISASSSYRDNGKIVVNEKKLKEALENNPDKVKSIFTSTAEDSPSITGSAKLSGGITTRIKTIMESYAKSTGSNKGKLVNLAGIKNNATTNDNYISRQKKILDNRLDYLKDLLKTRQDRYQKQFTGLETYMSKMNAQSSWLASSFS